MTTSLRDSPRASTSGQVAAVVGKRRASYSVNKKPTKGRSSCQGCRKAKQRCDLPHREAIHPSKQPQPSHLACHRCKILDLACIFELSREEWQQFAISDDTPPTQSGSTPEAITTVTSSPWQSRLNDASSSRNIDSSVHVFDPRFESDGFRDLRSKAPPRHRNDVYPPQQPSAIVDIADKLQSLRPYAYLYRLCSLQPNFLAFPEGKSGSQGNSSLDCILDKHSAVLDWQRLNARLQEYHFFLPFLEPFDQTHKGEELYLATRIYLAALQTDLTDLVADLLVFLRAQIVACILRGPASVGEASALVALAMYEPLIVARSAEEMQLDGSGLLAAASSALRRMNLERIPMAMRDFNAHPNGYTTSELLSTCALWITTAFVAGFNNLAINVMHRPFLECSLDDLTLVDHFCHHLLESPGNSPWAHQASYLMLLVFRYRSLYHFQDIIRTQLSTLEGMPMSPFGPAEESLTEGISRSFTYAKAVLNGLRILGHRLSLPAITCNMLMDYMEFETEQLHMFCIIHFSETCVLRIANVFGRPIALSTLVQRIFYDDSARQFAGSVSNMSKRDMSKKLITLFSNFASRWYEPIQQQQQKGAWNHGIAAPLALPPTYICAMMLINIKTMADYVGGTVGIDIYPRDCLDDCEAGMTVCLCRNHADALRGFADQSKGRFLAKGHRDFYQMTADIAMRTANAIHDWAATTKGLRVGVQSSGNHQQFNAGFPKSSEAVVSSSSLDVNIDRSDPGSQDFEDLLEQILSAPIVFT